MRRSVLVVLSLAVCLTAGACRQSSTDEDSRAKPDSDKPPASAEAADLGDFVIAAPVRHQNLTIFPVLSKVPKTEDRYITLEEGLNAGTVEIYEVGADGVRIDRTEDDPEPVPEESPMEESGQDAPARPDPEDPFSAVQNSDEALADEHPLAEGGFQDGVAPQEAADEDPPATEDSEDGTIPEGEVQIVVEDQVEIDEPLEQEVAGDVNRLMVLNTSGRPLYLMPGEVIYGGKQDRTIAEETIILASNKPQPIDVYCVEQGRWSGRLAAHSADAVMLLSDGQIDEDTAKKLAAEANRGKFVASAGNLSKKSRLAVHAGKGPEAQGEVWREVAGTIAAAEVEAPSGTFTANYATAEVVNQLKPYIEKLCEPVAEQKQVVGAIVAVNGKVESVDIFGSTPLFRKLWPKLLKSHALDAANAADAPEAEKVCTLRDARQFLSTAMQADVQESELEGGLVVTKRDSQGVASFSASVATGSDDARAEAAGMGGMGFGGSVHSSAFAK